MFLSAWVYIDDTKTYKMQVNQFMTRGVGTTQSQLLPTYSAWSLQGDGTKLHADKTNTATKTWSSPHLHSRIETNTMLTGARSPGAASQCVYALGAFVTCGLIGPVVRRLVGGIPYTTHVTYVPMGKNFKNSRISLDCSEKYALVIGFRIWSATDFFLIFFRNSQLLMVGSYRKSDWLITFGRHALHVLSQSEFLQLPTIKSCEFRKK